MPNDQNQTPEGGQEETKDESKTPEEAAADQLREERRIGEDHAGVAERPTKEPMDQKTPELEQSSVQGGAEEQDPEDMPIGGEEQTGPPEDKDGVHDVTSLDGGEDGPPKHSQGDTSHQEQASADLNAEETEAVGMSDDGQPPAKSFKEEQVRKEATAPRDVQQEMADEAEETQPASEPTPPKPQTPPEPPETPTPPPPPEPQAPPEPLTPKAPPEPSKPETPPPPPPPPEPTPGPVPESEGLGTEDEDGAEEKRAEGVRKVVIHEDLGDQERGEATEKAAGMEEEANRTRGEE